MVDRMSRTPFAAIQSVVNYSQTPLAGGATYPGTWERCVYGEVEVRAKSNVAGTLYIDFSTDGGTTTLSTITKTCLAGVAKVHRFVAAEYVRLRYTNGGSAQSSFDISLRHGIFGPLTNGIDQTIVSDADAQVVKAVVSGVGDSNAVVTDHQALQVTPPPEGKTAFGEALVGQLYPVIQETFAYSINSYKFKTRANQSGQASVSSAMCVVETGAAANSSCCVQTIARLKYEAGMGCRARFTGLFTTGVANSTQMIGIGDAGEGFFFGYNGTSFGVCHRKGGNHEIRTLTITTRSTTAENITVTLDGTAVSIAVTVAATISATANEIAAGDYSDVGRGWTARASGNTVIFVAWDASSRTGSYSVSGTTIVGSFAQTLAGTAQTDTWVAQSSWNGEDKFDGTGLTGVTLDPTKGNVFQIDFQYLGFGGIRFYTEDPDDGELHLVHTIQYANANTTPSLDNPTMPMRIEALNTSNTSNITTKCASMGGFNDGNRANIGINRGVDHNATIANSGTTPLMSIRIPETFKSKRNRSSIKLNLISCSCEHTKPVKLKFYANPSLTGAIFSSIDSDSCVYKDTSATAISGGAYIFSIMLGKAGNQVVNLLDDLDIGIFNEGDVLTAAVEYASGTNAEVSLAMNFTERL